MPDALFRGGDYEVPWRSGRLLLSQCCGLDLLSPLARHLQVVATPCYRALGCDGWSYRSAVVVREESTYGRIDDLRGGRCVINSPTSHSGMNILQAIVAPLHQEGRFFCSVEISGAHERSAAMVREGRADVAAIDVVTLEVLRRHRPEELQGLRELCRTDAYPAPPFVTSRAAPSHLVDLLRSALEDVCADAELRWVTGTLLLESVHAVPLSAYQPMVDLERRASELGYRDMAPSLA